ncbi:MAG TPA: CatA-like O-acetyltransferase [Candidatus Egerieousia sp.]|nr:CatA-like O-acetyltransferase [Candidatus Egerieousia sp.]HPT05883.1 CatA-like O-acetyltransferase [Candidatus Egerieousia sp.]
MKTKIDIQNWERKEVYEYFSKFKYPLGGVLADVDVTQVYDYAQSTGRSFYMTTLYNTLKIADSIENFRYRIENGEVYLYDNTSIGPTYLRKRNNTLAFVWFNNNSDIDSFIREARKAENQAEISDGLNLKADNMHGNLICFSCVPWINFTAVAEPFSPFDASFPHVVTGKFYKRGNKILMPVSVKIHHGFGDGYHLSLFLQKFSHINW